MNNTTPTVKTSEKVKRNLFILDFYDKFPGRKDDAVDVLADKYDLTRRRITYLVAQTRRKLPLYRAFMGAK